MSDSSCSKFHVKALVLCLSGSREGAEMAYKRARIEHTPAPLPPSSCYPYVSQAPYSHLSTFPESLAARIPDYSPQNFEACVHSVAALLTSFSRSYATHKTWAVWNGIESWPRMLSGKFLGMIETAHPFALILVAHWSALVKRQEEFYWFLGGQSERMLRIILANLDSEKQVFVQDCLATLNQAEIC